MNNQNTNCQKHVPTIATKDKMVEIACAFRDRVIRVTSYRMIQKEFYMNLPECVDGVNKSPAFWRVTERAYNHVLMADLAKLFEKKDDVYGIFHLLDVCEKNACYFSVPERLTGEDKKSMEAFFAGFGCEIDSVFREYQPFWELLRDRLNSLSPQIDNLRQQRNKIWMHNDKKNFLAPPAFEKQTQIDDTEIDQLIELLTDTVNMIMKGLGEGTGNLFPPDITDICTILKTMQEKAEKEKNGQTENALP